MIWAYIFRVSELLRSAFAWSYGATCPAEVGTRKQKGAIGGDWNQSLTVVGRAREFPARREHPFAAVVE